MERAKLLTDYIERTLGEHIHWLSTPPTKGLPHALRLGFELARGRLLHTDCLFVFSAPNAEVAVPTLERQIELIQQRMNLPSIVVFDQLSTRTTERLVTRRIPFVVIGRQIYLPFLLIQLRREAEKPALVRNAGPLSPAAETILVGQLLDGRFESKSGEEVTNMLTDSPMLASNAIRELEERGLCEFQKDGRKKRLQFIDRQALWETAKQLLRNPVQTVKYASRTPEIPWAFAGISALAKQSLLSDDNQQTVAIFRRDLRQSEKTAKGLSTTDDQSAPYKVEVWNRRPGLFSHNSSTDPVSLYLTLRNEPDERVQSQLAALLSRIGLQMHGAENG